MAEAKFSNRGIKIFFNCELINSIIFDLHGEGGSPVSISGVLVKNEAQKPSQNEIV